MTNRKISTLLFTICVSCDSIGKACWHAINIPSSDGTKDGFARHLASQMHGPADGGGSVDVWFCLVLFVAYGVSVFCI